MATPTEADRVNSLLDHLVVQQATELVCSGDYVGADSLLASIDLRSSNMTEALDLRAKIHAQQGRFEDARSFWSQILKLDPANASAIAGIARIDRLRRYPMWVFWLAPVSLTALALAAVAAVALFESNAQIHNRDLIVGKVRDSATSQQLALGQMADQITSLSTKMQTLQELQSNTSKVLRRTLTINQELSEQATARRRFEKRLSQVLSELTGLRNEMKGGNSQTDNAKTSRHRIHRDGNF